MKTTAGVRDIGSSQSFVKWPVDAACVGATTAAEFILQAGDKVPL